MASKNKKKTQFSSEVEKRKKIADYIFAFLAIILIISMVLSAFVTY